MPWVRLDDGMAEHRKTRRLLRAGGTGAFGLHALALIHCGKYLTDGHVDEEFVDEMCDVAKVKPKDRARVLDALVACGQWTVDEKRGGWLIHDYLDHNPSRAKVEERREKDAARKAAGRAGQSDARDPGPDPDDPATADGFHVESEPCPRGHDADSAGSPSVPSRTRPVPDPSIEQQQRAHAPDETVVHPRLDEVVDILADPSLSWPLDVEPMSVDRVLRANVDLDAVAAAQTVASWANDPDPLDCRVANRLLGRAFQHLERRQAQVRDIRAGTRRHTRGETHDERVARLKAEAAAAHAAENRQEAHP